MDYHLLAILEKPEDSDFDSETEFPTVVSGFLEIQPKGQSGFSEIQPIRPNSKTGSSDQEASGQQD